MSDVEGWKTSSLPLLLRLMKSGGTPDTSRSDYYGGQIPFVSIEDMTASNKHLTSTIKKLTDKGLKNSNAWLVPEKSILYSIYATLGLPRINTIPVTTNQAILALINDPKKIDRDYLYYWFEYIRASVVNFSSQTTQSNLSATIVKTFLVDHPTNLSEQTKIAEVLSTVDRAIEQTEALIAKQQRIKTGLMQDLLTCGIDEEGNLRSEQTHEFKDSPHGRIPVEWKVLKWSEVCNKIQDGTHFSPRTDSSAEFKYVTSKNIKFGFLDISYVEYIDKRQHDEIYKKCDVCLGDVLLTKDGANTGNAAINLLNEEFSLLSSVALIRPMKSKLTSMFLLQTILSESGQRLIKDAMSGLAITRVTLEIINNFIMKVPPIQEQKNIGQFLAVQDERIKSEASKLAKLHSLKTALMQDLLTGKKRVTTLLEKTP